MGANRHCQALKYQQTVQTFGLFVCFWSNIIWPIRASIGLKVQYIGCLVWFLTKKENARTR